MDIDKVVLVTVTFNSTQYLKRLIDSILESTYPLEKVIIVDNKSSDENKEVIRSLIKGNSLFKVLWSKENRGGAGGFEFGMRYAVKEIHDYDWIWFMDDDAFLRPDCLEKLLQHKNEEKIGILAPVIYGVEWEKYQLYHVKKMNEFLNDGTAVAVNYDDLPEVCKFETDAFVGPLISRAAIEKLGYPDGRLFIYGDDIEYSYRLSREFNNYLIKDAIINHRDTDDKAVSIWKLYYKYRNKILFIKKFGLSKKQKIKGISLVRYEALKDQVKVVVRDKYQNNKGTAINTIEKGIIDGLNGKYGKTLDPVEFSKKLR